MIMANTNIEKIMSEVDNLRETINEQLAIFTQVMTSSDRESIMLSASEAIDLAMEGRLNEISLGLEYEMSNDEEWDNIVALIQKINTMVRESLSETPNPERAKPFGFAAIAAKVNDEIAATEAKRDKDRRFVRAIINDVVGDYGLTDIINDVVDDIRMGLNTDAFRNITQFIMRDIESIINPRLDESGTLREFSDLLHKAYTAAIRPCVWEYNSHWTEYLNAFCPDAMKRIEESDCQFKAECKRSLTFIALRLELDALKAAFPTEVASDDDEWI